MYLPNNDDRLNARIAVERQITGEPLDAARGICWMCLAVMAVLAVIVAGAVLAYGVK